jgi:GH24 family phage-related lysozyme (muramidase)
MQPITSAANSGIGQSPTGLVEGTTVIVIFRDENQQQPIIIGSVAGIPVKPVDKSVEVVLTTESAVWTTSDGFILKDSSGDPVQSGTPKAPEGKLSAVDSTIKKPTSALVPGPDCFTSIRDEEAFSSTVEGKNNYIRVEKFNALAGNTPIYPYQDTKGIWTIGWGSTFLNGGKSNPVTSETRLTKDEADALMKDAVNNFFGPQIQKKLTAPVTQSMFDALVSMAYNAGVDGMTSSAVFSAVNAANYEQAAALITTFRNNKGTLAARRGREKALFSKDGFPTKDMSSVTPPPEQTQPVVDAATQNPVVTPYAPGEQPGAADAKQTGSTTTETRKLEGFKDPNGVYPKFFDEPDTHRLARHEKIDQTIVFAKESARAKGVISGGDGKWSQPPIPYNAKYPYNHARVTESGHVQEFDDTEGNERIHTYHRSGTYEEIDVNGTRVNRIVGDAYEILERNGNVLIRGSLNVTIIGNNNIRVENDANIDVLGNVNQTVGGDFNLGITGDLNMNVKGDINIASGGNTMINTGGSGSWDGSRLDLNSGKGQSLSNVTGKGSAGGLPDFPTLQVPTRSDEQVAQYETPEDGDPTDYNKKLEASGVTDSSDPTQAPNDSAPQTEEIKDTTDQKKPNPKVTDCSMIPNEGPVDLSFQLSPNFKLRDLNGDRLSSPPAVQLTRAEAVCNLKKLAENCLEPIKKAYPNMHPTSGFRNSVPKGGSTTSDHLYGCACDFQLSGFNRMQHYEAAVEIAKLLPAYTQLIFETRGSSTWIHVAFNDKRGLRMEKFTMVNDKRVSPNLTTIISVA